MAVVELDSGWCEYFVEGGLTNGGYGCMDGGVQHCGGGGGKIVCTWRDEKNLKPNRLNRTEHENGQTKPKLLLFGSSYQN